MRGYVPAMARRGLIGRWRIVDIDLWNRDVLDLVAPAYFELRGDGRGCFGFIAVEGDMDCRYARAAADRRRRRGVLRGRFFFHAGDDPGFVAVRRGHETAGIRLADADAGARVAMWLQWQC